MDDSLPKKPLNPMRESKDNGICGAATRAGGICNKYATPLGKCRHHGGASKQGIAAPNFKTGRHSKYLKQLADDIGERVNDPELLDPRRSIAVQESVMAKLADLEAKGDSPEFREEARRRMNEAMAALADDVTEGVRKLRALQGFLQGGADAARALMGMGAAAEMLGRGQERYWKTALSASRAISPDEFVGLMFRLADIIETESKDPQLARRILQRADREVCGGSLGLG